MARFVINGPACDIGPVNKPAVWTLRVLLAIGLALSGFLAYMHWSALRAAAGSAAVKFPLCGKLPGLDCESVFNSSWALWLGVPVAAWGFGVYVILLLSAIRFPRCPWSRTGSTFCAALLAGAAVWFIVIQAAVLGQWCPWCMATHGVSIALAAIIWPMAWRRGARLYILLLIVAGLACAGAMAAGQRAEQGPGSDMTTGAGSPLHGQPPKLDLSQHIVIGPRDAKQYVIEAMDFRCHRCAVAWPVVEKARELMGDKVALVIVPAPLCADCNHYIKYTPEGFELSCELAKLAWAVWLAAPDQYLAYHQWLLSHQQCTVDEAKSQARSLVGDQLDRTLTDPRIDQYIHRDVELAASLNMETLPAMLAGRLRISALPDDPHTLAMLWTTGLAGENGKSNEK